MTTEHAEVNKETDVVRRDASVDILKGVTTILGMITYVFKISGSFSQKFGKYSLL